MVHKEPGSHPDPEQPAFETFFRVRFHEVDSLGHVNNAAYLNYVEQAAIDHATFLGLDLQRLQRLGGVFVARRHEIEFLKPTFAGDVLRVVTWLDEPRGARVDRRYLVFREPSSIPEVVVAGRPMGLCKQPGSAAPDPRRDCPFVPSRHERGYCRGAAGRLIDLQRTAAAGPILRSDEAKPLSLFVAWL
jgi:YbgC/YbaW family acyl-CoA thioester hydrolase